MTVTRNDWTPLFNDLRHRLSPFRRQVMMSQAIGAVQKITVANFGKTGIDRPHQWPKLKKRYANWAHDGDTTPTLELDGRRHNLKNPGEPHLIDSFQATANPNSARLTNSSPYAEVHEQGLRAVPKRMVYPVTESGLTPFAEQQVFLVIEKHFAA